MSRVIHTDSTGKNRSRLMRTCAELLRHLSTKPALDEEARDMAACLVFSLREIDEGIDESASVWEKRDYWMKAEKLRQRWYWVSARADELNALILNEEWQRMPEMMVRLLPHFADVKITRLTRTPDVWEGAYARLLKHQP
ncbi:MAG: hypothetical protein JXN59_09950 [Anaerolineae bacterium]|nr:hypothetical protein [Anaerolineae bacterium]